MHRFKIIIAFLAVLVLLMAVASEFAPANKSDVTPPSPQSLSLASSADKTPENLLREGVWQPVELPRPPAVAPSHVTENTSQTSPTQSPVRLVSGHQELGAGECETCGPAAIPLPDTHVTVPSNNGSSCSSCGAICPVPGQGCRACGHMTQVKQRLEYRASRGIRPFKNHPNDCSECGIRRQITGVDSATCVDGGEPDWGMRQPIPWDLFAQGEYVGPARSRHVDKYRLRVDDALTVVFRITRNRLPQAYELNVGDEIRVEAVADEDLDRRLIIQPDGTVTLRLLGQVLAAGRTVDELRRDLEQRYTEFYQEPAVTVTPEKVNTKLEDLRDTVDARAGLGGQQFDAVIAPDGTIQLPALGSVAAHGLTLEELKLEIDARYDAVVLGLEATPVLRERAPRFIYVAGEVARPGRFELVGPTTVTQAITLAEGWNNGANLRTIVIFRRAEDWRLMATKIDIRGAFYGRRPAPSDEIWLRDSDIVIVPKTPLKVVDDALELLFTNGLYAIFPFLGDPIIFTDASKL